jgi:hypothetical protein
MSTTVTQLRLPGQTAAPEGPVDMSAMYVMHHGFRRDLAAFATAARTTPTEDRATWRALAGRWALFSRVLHHHHSGEDAGLWPLLMQRADERGRATLEAMEAEHAEIDPMLEACTAGFERLAERADDDARAALAVRLCAAKESLGRHLQHEETEAIALVQRLMTNEEWLALDEEFFKRGLTPRDFLSLVPWAAHGLSPQARDQAFAAAGRAFQVIWWLGRRRFERRERVAFRYR